MDKKYEKNMLADDELMRGNFVMFFDKHKIEHKAIVDQVLRHSCLLMYTTEDAGVLANYLGYLIYVRYALHQSMRMTTSVIL